MNLEIAFLTSNYRYEAIPQPYTRNKVQTTYRVFPLEQFKNKELDEIIRSYPDGPLHDIRKSKDLHVVEFIYGLEAKSDKTYRVHLCRSLNSPESVNTILKKFPRETQIYRYPAKGRNERYLLARRISVTFRGEQAPKDLKFFASNSRLIDVLLKNDPNLYTKHHLAQAKAEFQAKAKPEDKVKVKKEVKAKVKKEAKAKVKEEDKAKVKEEVQVKVKPAGKAKSKAKTEVKVKGETEK